jgi:hypothetical protein
MRERKKSEALGHRSTSQPERHLITASQIIVKRMKTPDRLTEFLLACLNWIHEEELINQTTAQKGIHFGAVFYVEHLAIAWESSKTDPLLSLKSGLKEIMQMHGFRGHAEVIQTAYNGFVRENSETEERFARDYLDRIINGFTMLFEIGIALTAYEGEIFGAKAMPKLEAA